MRTCLLISANAEWNAVKEFLQPSHIHHYLYGECFDFILGNYLVNLLHTGWGKSASAGAMQYVIDTLHPDITINLGTCGGIGDLVSLDETILVEGTFIYDILDLMDGSNIPDRYYASQLDLSWLPEPFPHPVRRGILASADSDLQPDKIPILKSQGALAADWESGALSWVANKNNARLLILRAVSDLVTEKGGEAYGNIELYKERTMRIMGQLLDRLPDWLTVIEPQIP
jgi:nucleoside phosphorylase